MDARTQADKLIAYLRRALWLQVLVGIQIALLVLGVIFNSMGEPNTGFGEHMDFWQVTGGLAGALALYVMGFTLLLLAIAAGFRVRDRFGETPDF